jgi:cell pole-organizing protein PopZ
MNKPAPKEPSMDEILSSIRQIIADDDAAGAPRRPSVQAAPPPMQAAPARALSEQGDRDLSDMLDDIEPLALSPSQIVEDGDEPGGFSFDSILADTESTDDDGPALVEAEDVGFDIDDDLPNFDPAPARPAVVQPIRAPEPAPVARAMPAPEPEPEPVFEPEPEFEPQVTASQAAPLPDPTLTSDMAEQLLEPATRAAVRGSIGKLSALGIGNPGLTIEAMMRDMLRPMLKEWLDENLPAVVERMVEKEISRVSRGE